MSVSVPDLAASVSLTFTLLDSPFRQALIRILNLFISVILRGALSLNTKFMHLTLVLGFASEREAELESCPQKEETNNK